MRRLNLKLLFIIVAVAAALGAGGLGAYKYQKTRTVAALLVEARAAEKSGDHAKADGLYSHYLGLRSDDTATMADYGFMLAGDAKTPKDRMKALLVLAQVVRRDPKRVDVRREIVRIATDRTVQRHAQALEQLETLLAASPDDGELEFQAGRSEEAERNYSKAAEWYEKAIAHAPKQTDAYLRLAGVLGDRLDRADDAEKVFDRMIASDPDSYRPYLERGNRRLARGLTEEAGRDVARALELAPGEVDVLAASASLAINRGDFDGARDLAARCLKAREKEGRFYDLAARVEMGAGKPEAAESILRQGLERIAEPEARVPLLGVLADFLIREGDHAGAGAAIEKLRADKANPAYVRYLEARVLAGEGRWREAAKVLDEIHVDLARIPELAFDADLLLARCCERLGEPDRRFAAMDRAVALRPKDPRARLGIAEALSAAGRVEESLSQYQAIEGEIPAARLGLARLLIIRNLRRPPAERDWREVDRALAAAEAAFPDAIEIPILRASSLDERGDLAGAAQGLRLAISRSPKNEELPIALANHLALKERNPQAAAEVLDRAEKALGDWVGLRLARANACVARGGREAIEAVDRLGEQLDKFSEGDRVAVLRGLAEAHRQLGDPAGGRRILERLVAKSPDDLNLQIVLFDLAYRAGDGPAMKAVVDAMAGKDEVLARLASARYLAWSAAAAGQPGRPSRAPLEEARKILGQIANQRPGWLPVVLASAQVDDLAGRLDPAVRGYLEAIDLGERSTEVGFRAIVLLMSRERFDRADEVVRKCLGDTATPKEPLFYRLAAEVAIRVKDAPRALECVTKAMPKGAKSPLDLLWRGRILWEAGKLPEAGRDLRSAAETAGEAEAPDAWATLVAYLVATNQRPQAEKAIEQARRALPERLRPSTLARCFAAVGQAEKAREQYRAAVSAAPDDAATLATAADVAVQVRQFNDAVDYLRRLAARQADAPELAARSNKTLAVLLAVSRDRQLTAEALKLLNLNEDGIPFRPTPETPIEDLRSIAEVLALKGGPRNRRVALECAQAIADRGNPTRNDRFLLAQILEMNGEWSKASEQLQLALADPDPPAVMLAFHVRGLLVHDKGAGAKPRLDALEKLDPSSAQTVELKARLALIEGQPEKASRLILDHARANPDTTFAFAELLEKLGRIDDAEKLYREVAAGQGPGASLPLATFLGRQNRVKQALDLCDKSWDSARPELVARTSVEILYASAPGEDACRRVVDRIDAALRKTPKLDLELSRVYVQMLREEYADAEALFRKLHEQDPKNSIWANNLAMVLTFQDGKATEAVALIDEAIDLVGPIASLLDTRGRAKAAAGRDDAIDDFVKATAAEATAERYLHLALAYRKANRTPDAKEALRKANDLGLEPSRLQPRDRKEFGKLVGELEGS